MKITIDNYETYVIDYLEDNLDSLLRGKFEEFLRSNPEIQEEVEDCLGVALESMDEVTFDAKINLYRSEDIDDAIISVVERVASEDEFKYIEDLAKRDDVVKQSLNIYSLIRLIPDHEIVCDFKNKLYKKHFVFDFTKKVISIAATILLFIGIHQVLVAPRFDTTESGLSKSEEYKKSFMPPKYTLEREIYRKDSRNEGLAQVESPKHIEEVKQVIETAKEIEATYASVREMDQMEYIEPVAISFESNEVDVQEICLPESKDVINIVDDKIDFKTRPNKLKYDVKEELDQPLQERVVGEKKVKRRRFLQKIGTTIASISDIYYE
ncbi:hypothetical protein K5X82_12285 [Halosquirtibacter xylanolyticus]|uniref:hypothetical protein n=1 Tax=Halosquirtibacter xylanolyticus TaxID=3374599 RepID=UPI003748FCDD|nr:hypothetical protein K5X82_12285 [Prolixibacteraceae bacterium]